MNKFRASLILGLAVLTHLSCGDESVRVDADPADILISPLPLDLDQFATVQLQVTVVDEEGEEIEGAQVSYLSTTPTIVSISSTGLVTSLGPVGLGSVRVTSDTVVRTVGIPVNPVPGALVLALGSDISIRPMDSVPMGFTVLDLTGQPMNPESFSFQSSNPAVALVDGAQKLRAGTLGDATITLTAGAFQAQAEIHVIDFVRQSLPGQPFGVAVNPADIAYVATLSSNGVARFDLPGTSISANILRTAQDVAFNSSGTDAYLATVAGVGIPIVDVATDSIVDSIGSIQGTPFTVQLSGDNQWIYIGGNEGLFQVEAATGSTVKYSNVFGHVNHLSRHPTQPLIYATAPDVSDVFEINTVTQTSRTFDLNGHIQATAVSSNGSRLFVANESQRRLDIWDLIGNVPLPSVALNGNPYGLVLNPAGTRLYASLTGSGLVQVIDPVSLQTVTTYVVGGLPRAVEFSTDGSIAVSANEAGWVDFLP